MTKGRSNREKRFCVDCRSITVQGSDFASATCAEPRMQRPRVDLVSGETLATAPYLCSYARGSSTLCGISARFFVEKKG